MKPQAKEKILIIRFSSIGDIVLTTPIIRSLRACKPQAEIHFLTKSVFVPLVENNPYLDGVLSFDGDLAETVKSVKMGNYDMVLDLHGSLRSRLLRLRTGVRAEVYPKDRLPVWLFTKFRLGKLPGRHTVQRYASVLSKIGCGLDQGGVDFFLPDGALETALDRLKGRFSVKPVVIALGGKTATKRWPRESFVELIRSMGMPVVLLGGKAEQADAEWIASRVEVTVYQAAGQLGLLEGAALIPHSAFVISHDSGFMHIASAFDRPMITLWGSTVPELGFSPYLAGNAQILERKDLACRPCSKLGSDQCPRKHFDCMKGLKPAMVMEVINQKNLVNFQPL